MRFAVVAFGGSNCDYDTTHVLSDVIGVDCDRVWYKDGLKRSYDAVILPGGFSYGDYLRAGAIAARTPIMNQVKDHAEKGGLVLGICNGAQICAESGLIPGVFTINAYPKFICKPALLRVETTESPFTNQFRPHEVIHIPIAHMEGRYVPPEKKDDIQVAFRFCDKDGNLAPEANPNGSHENITGVLGGAAQNVLAMMPHPERASEEILGSTDGRRIFESMIHNIQDRSD
jgi:phosphoribosylformylglycinamidine synthase